MDKRALSYFKLPPKKKTVVTNFDEFFKSTGEEKPKFALPLEAIMSIEMVTDEDRKNKKHIKSDKIQAFKVTFDKTFLKKNGYKEQKDEEKVDYDDTTEAWPGYPEHQKIPDKN